VRGRDRAGAKYVERRQWPRAGCRVVSWWAIFEGPEIIGATEAPSADRAEQVAGLRFPDRPVRVRLWSACTVAQRARARAELPECRLIEGA